MPNNRLQATAYSVRSSLAPASGRGSTRGYSRERSTNEGWSEQMEFQVQPEIFTRLKSGGPQHGNEVQAVIFKSGAQFPPTGKPFTGVTFKQS
jgi:hypothetical protein